MMKYIKGEQTWTLEEAQMGKMRLSIEGKDIENIWVKRKDNEAVLQNHALNLYPFPSWGAIIPSSGSAFDLKGLREGMQLTLHPEAYDQYVGQGVITEDGEFIQPTENKDNGQEDSGEVS